jgi:uncharacterized protein YwqG
LFEPQESERIGFDEYPMTDNPKAAKKATLGGRGCLLAVVALGISIGIAVGKPIIGVPMIAVALILCWRAMLRAKALETAEYQAKDARLQSIAPPRGDAWRALLEAEGLAPLVEDLTPHTRAAVRLSTRPAEHVPLGHSRMGGTPDLPAGLAWPRRDGVPLAFVAQLNLQEVAQALPDSPLPGRGFLWFFYDTKSYPGGYHPAHAGGAVVLYHDTAAALEPGAPLADAPKGACFTFCTVEFESYRDIPDWEPDGRLASRLTDEENVERYLEIRSYLAHGMGDSSHKLLGYADPIQNAMELECQLVTQGIDCASPKGYDDPRAKQLAPGAADWRLLLQVDSDEKASMMWGDLGRVYYWIREADLRAARFDRTWTIFQCH